ncbi:MAG: hypothetical protein KAS32_28940, partial [Candidatus Peribacteraceae bacterium]|nr:hypothetical protein [Candidatus Peribacteraceae bacterium]
NLEMKGNIWFTQMGGLTVGIVLCTDKVTGEEKAYVGTASEGSEEADAERIMSHGGKFPVDIAQKLIYG